jgi:VanZ family protein
MSRRTALWALVVYVAALAVLVLGASPEPALRWTAATVRTVDALSTVSTVVVERAANVLLFVPAGLLLCYALPRSAPWLVWLLCVAVSAGAEVAQLALPERAATVVDVLMNAAGAAIGVLLHLLLTRLPRRSGTVRRRA